jgi:hypothetical protein
MKLGMNIMPHEETPSFVLLVSYKHAVIRSSEVEATAEPLDVTCEIYIFICAFYGAN